MRYHLLIFVFISGILSVILFRIAILALQRMKREKDILEAIREDYLIDYTVVGHPYCRSCSDIIDAHRNPEFYGCEEFNAYTDVQLLLWFMNVWHGSIRWPTYMHRI